MTIQTAPPKQHEPIFGREREIATLRLALDSARAQQGRLVLISGEAGIGKTALIEHLLAKEAGGIVALSAACRELTTSPPYGIWTDLFNSYQRPSDKASAAIVPEGLLSGGDLERAGTRGEFFADVLTFMTQLAAEQPVVIVLEDLHWSDDASLELLHHLAISLDRHSIVIVGSYRDIEVTSGIPLYGRLPGLVRDSRALRIELRQIDEAAIASLVASSYPMHSAADQQQLAAWLYRHGEGIPFFTIELLYNLEADGKLRRPSGRADDYWTLVGLGSVQVPLLIRQFVDQRLERLAPEQIQILQLAAVIGNEVPLDLWTALADIDEMELIDVIEASQQIGIIRELPTGDGYRFSHALFRATLYNQLILPRRRAWHTRAAEALAGGLSSDPDIVAHHFQLAGDPRAGRWLITAGQRAIKSFAYEMASQRFEQALDILGEGELPAHEQGWLLCDLAMTFRFADAARGLRYVNRALQLARETENEALELFGRWCRAQIRSLRGDDALDDIDAIADVLSFNDRAEDFGASVNSLNRGALAQSYGRYGAYEQAREIAQSYLERHRREVSEAVVRAYSGLALAAAGQGEVAVARDAFSRGRAIASQLRDPHLTGMLLNWELMEITLPYDGDRREARKHLAADALAAWDRVQMPGSRASLRQAESKLSEDGESRPSTDMSVYATLLLDGDWESAEEQAMIDMEFDGMRFDALRVLSILALRRGKLNDARGFLQRALPQGPSTQPSNYYFFSALWLQRTGAEIALASDDLTLATRWVDAHDRWLEWSGRLLNRAESLLLRGQIHEMRGELEHAQRCADDALKLATEPRQPLALIEAERYLGRLAVETGDFGSAEHHLDEGLRIAAQCGAPYEIATVQLERVKLFRRRGQPEEADSAAAEVRQTAEFLGVQPLLDRLAEAESETVATERTDLTPGGLSPRELEVLQHVARGMTDSEVGEALFISPRTVGRHLRSVYNKLGVNSRTAASAFAFQHGLIEDE